MATDAEKLIDTLMFERDRCWKRIELLEAFVRDIRDGGLFDMDIPMVVLHSIRQSARALLNDGGK